MYEANVRKRAWWFRGSQNDKLWRSLSPKEKVYWEIGQKTLNDGKQLAGLPKDPVACGQAMVRQQGLLRALLPERSGLKLGLGKTAKTFPSGPSPSVRALGNSAALESIINAPNRAASEFIPIRPRIVPRSSSNP